MVRAGSEPEAPSPRLPGSRWMPAIDFEMYYFDATNESRENCGIEWINMCRSASVDKAINDDGILEIRVFRATDVWPAFTNNITRHPINLFDPINALEEAGPAIFVA